MPAVFLAMQIATPIATELRRLPAAEAHQGAAADRRSVFAIADSTIARYDQRTGRRLAVWRGDPVKFPHVNSCALYGKALVCAGSNYPSVPMTSQLLWFDPGTLKLRRVRALVDGPGSLTWFDWHDGSWWAGFANYDGRGGAPGRDHRATMLVRYSADFVEQARWRFPDVVLDRFAPRSSSGGAWGDDGLLYVTGHDRPELYALRVPSRGGTLELVATIETPTGGQAIGWQPGAARHLWSIDRAGGVLVLSRIPRVAD